MFFFGVMSTEISSMAFFFAPFLPAAAAPLTNKAVTTGPSMAITRAIEPAKSPRLTFTFSGEEPRGLTLRPFC